MAGYSRFIADDRRTSVKVPGRRLPFWLLKKLQEDERLRREAEARTCYRRAT